MDTYHTIALRGEAEVGAVAAKMNLPAALPDFGRHGLDDGGQLVGADVGVGVGEHLRSGTKLMENLEDSRQVAPLV